MTYIIDKLYMGDLEDACDSVHLRNKLQVTHILSVMHKPLATQSHEGFTYKYVNALDSIEADLLSHLEDCNTFISEGREAGGVLVHCQAGVSRSGTVVLAYVMQKMDLTLKKSLKLIRSQRAQISPNAGFHHQLELYEAMGNKVDVSSKQYKTYKLELLAVQMQRSRGEHQSLPDEYLLADPSKGTPAGETVYKCKKCRRILLQASSLLVHDEGCGEESFNQPWLTHKRADHVTCMQSLFMEPVLWMKEQILQLEGKLMCPKCNAKLGSFNWCGEHCSCGSFVCPAFHMATSKMDKCLPLVLPPSAQRPSVTKVTKMETEGSACSTDG